MQEPLHLSDGEREDKTAEPFGLESAHEALGDCNGSMLPDSPEARLHGVPLTPVGKVLRRFLRSRREKLRVFVGDDALADGVDDVIEEGSFLKALMPMTCRVK